MIKFLIKLCKNVLTEKQYKWVRSKFRLLLRFYSVRIYFPLLYKIVSFSKPVNRKKVVFLEVSSPILSSNFRYIYEYLDPYDYEKIVLYFNKLQGGDYELYRRSKEIVKEIVDAKVIFINEGINVFGKIKLRHGSKIVNVWHGCGAFKKFGRATGELIFGPTIEELDKYPLYSYADEFYVSSPEVVKEIAFSTGLPEEKVVPIGVSRTDVFFDDEFKRKAREKFELFCPAAKGKKVILYAPTFRGRVKRAKAPNCLNVDMFRRELADKYVLIRKEHQIVKRQISISNENKDFAFNFTNVMTIEELLCVSDILITDYSSLVFEYSLFEKPMIFFAFDKTEYDDWRGFYYPYEEMTPGPVFTKNSEIIDYIKHIDELFNKQEVIDFKNRFMCSCDGHSTERIVNRNFTEFNLKSQGTCEEKEEIVQESELLDIREKSNVLEALLDIYPQLADKKIVCYVVQTVRNNYLCKNQYIDWYELYETIPDEYVVLYSKKGPPFSSDAFLKKPAEISEEELLSVADMIVTNKPLRAEFFDKPVYFYIPDIRWRCSNKEEYEEKKKYCIETIPELIEKLGTESSGYNQNKIFCDLP